MPLFVRKEDHENDTRKHAVQTEATRFNYSFPMDFVYQVTADGEEVVSKGKSLGGEGNTATSVEVFTFEAGGVAPKKIRYTGLGNRREKNGRWIEVALLLIGNLHNYTSAYSRHALGTLNLILLFPYAPPPLFPPIVAGWKP